jgi:hypothetical protein
VKKNKRQEISSILKVFNRNKESALNVGEDEDFYISARKR